MTTTALTTALLIVSVALTDATLLLNRLELTQRWHSWKTEHRRGYNSAIEEFYRRKVFARNLLYVKGHNRRYDAGLESYTVGLNQFADMTREEFKTMYLGLSKESPLLEGVRKWKPLEASKEVPEEVDWRNKSAVTEIKNQVGFTRINLSNQ